MSYPSPPKVTPEHLVVQAALTLACKRYGCWPNARTGLCNRCGQGAR